MKYQGSSKSQRSTGLVGLILGIVAFYGILRTAGRTTQPGRGPQGFYFHLIKQTNFPPGRPCVFVRSDGRTEALDIASLVQIETDAAPLPPETNCELVYGGGHRVLLDILDNKPGNEFVAIPRGYRDPPKNPVIQYVALRTVFLGRVALGPLPPSGRLLPNAKPDPRVTANWDPAALPGNVIRIQIHCQTNPSFSLIAVARGTSFGKLTPTPGAPLREPGTDATIVPCPFPEDVHTVDVQVLKVLPAVRQETIVLPDVELSTEGGLTYLEVAKSVLKKCAAGGTITAERYRTVSPLPRQIKLRLEFTPADANQPKADLKYRWVSPDPATVGLTGVWLPDQSQKWTLSSGVPARPLKAGNIGPVKIEATIVYHRAVPWFRTVIPVEQIHHM
jgi:hypothetical protein